MLSSSSKQMSAEQITENLSDFSENESTQEILRTRHMTPKTQFLLKRTMGQVNVKGDQIALRIPVASKGKKEIKKISQGAMVHEWRDNKKLHLTYTGTPVSQDLLDHLSFATSHFAKTSGNLQEVQLEFKWCREVNDKSIEIIGAGIARSLPNLKQLRLNFEGCGQITDKGIAVLASELAKVNANLKELALNFSLCTQITDKGLSTLITKISRHLVNLEHLTLDFTNCYRLSDKSIKTLAFEIGWHLFKLRRLGLYFTACKDITDEGIKAFAHEIPRHLTNLRKLTLEFFGCNSISDEGIKALGKEMANHLGALKHLIFYFSDVGISKECHKELTAMLGPIPISDILITSFIDDTEYF